MEDEELRPADALRARAEATDRAGRFQRRLAAVERDRARRRVVRRWVRVLWVVVGAAAAPVAAVVVAAVVRASAPGGTTLLVAALLGAVVGGVAPPVRDALARRRGASAWDAYRERYVLLGDPSADVRDADRPEQQRGGPPPPPPRR